MKKTRSAASTEVVLIILVAVGILGSLPLMELRAEEPRRAVVAMEMLLKKNYIVPKIFGVNYYNKPPLFNWLMALLFKLTGSCSEVCVRLPSILSLFITAALVYSIVKRQYNRQTGFIAAILLLVSVDILFYGSVDSGEIDIFLTLLLFMQTIALYHFGRQQKWWVAFLLSYLCMAAGVLTKGAPSIVIQGLVLLSWLAYTKQLIKLFSIQHIVSALIAVGIVYLYFLQYSQQQDVLLFIAQLLTESAQRSAAGSELASVAVNILQSPLQVFYICLPATAILLYAANKKVRVLLKGQTLFTFSLIVALVIWVVFFISPDTANRYVYPAFPFIAIMAAIIYNKAAEAMSISRWFVKYNVLLGMLFFLAIVRIGYDAIIPYQQQHLAQNYRNLSANILQYTRHAPVYLTGHPQKNDVNTFPFIQPKQDSINAAPVIPYQIPYYITRATNTIMRYDSIPLKGLFYLAPASFIKDKTAVVYFTFFDNWLKREMALVKF